MNQNINVKLETVTNIKQPIAMNDIKNKLKKQLEGPTNIVLENIELTGELTNFLFSETNIKKIYLIKYNSSSISQLNQIINNKEICSTENLTISDLNNEGIVFCLDKSNYFNPNYSLIANHKSIKALCFLGFPESSFSVTPQSKTCIVTNKSISELITSNNTANTLQTQTDTSKTRICHNRNSEKNALVNFLANNDKRLLIIHGFPGLGKSNLLDELKRKAPNREYIPFTFESQSDTYKDIIHEIAPYFSLNIPFDELRQIQINDRTQRDLINGFFNSFNVRENSTLIFESVHKILNNDNEAGRFISPEIKFFFELLITHLRFKASNKIIFLSRSPLQLNDEIRMFSTEIRVKELEPFYIKRIMADEYNRINRPELSVKIGTFPDDEKINTIICGHPTLALRFVDASLKHGLEELLNNNDFRYQIGYDLKVKWLMDNYPLGEVEKKALEILSLFTQELPDNFINTHFTNAHSILETLTNRYLVDVDFYIGGKARYFVPNLIKDYIKGISDREAIKQNHDIIADYFWDRAENITVSSQEKTSSYRKAFYHFRESENHEKLKLLAIRFREKFIIEAEEATRKKLWDDAYFYFNELHLQNLIGIDNPIEYNKFIKVLSKINPKPKNTQSLVLEIHSMFPNDSFIAVSYADYLFDKNQPNELQEAIKECYRIKEVLEKSEFKGRGFSVLDKAIVDNTLAKCLFKEGKKELAINLIDNWKKHFDKRGNLLSDKEKYHYQAILMTHYRGLEDYETYTAIKKKVLGKIKADMHSLPKHEYFTSEYTYCFKGNQSGAILKQLEKVESFKHDHEKVLNMKRRHIKNLIEESYFINLLKDYFYTSKSAILNSANGITDIEELITTSKQLLAKINSVSSKNNFPTEYAKVGLMEVEADFFILKTIIQHIYTSR